MFFNVFRSAWRSLSNNKIYTIINITGLAAGIAACLLIGLYVTNEMSFDRQIPDRANVYRLNEYMHYPGTTPQVAAAIGPPISPLLKADHPEIISYARVLPATPYIYPDITLEYAGKRIKPTRLVCTDTSFADMFGVTIMEGRRSDFIRDRHSITLTASLARKLFGNGSAAGKMITLRVDDTTAWPTVVSNVINDFPANSHLQVEGLLPISAEFQKSFLGTSYGVLLGPAYFRLQPHVDLSALDSGLNRTLHQKFQWLDMRLQPVSEIHSGSTDINSDAFNSNKIDGKYIRIFIVVALAIFVIACFNFINLTIAVAAWRGKEIAVKKIMGAGRGRIIIQVLTETFVATFLALTLAILMAYIFLPFLNQILGRHLDASALHQPPALGAYMIILLVSILFAGGYPALLISSSRISEALRSKVLFHGSRTTLRNALVTGQFTIAVVFVVTLIVSLRQLKFMQDKDLGYAYDQIVNVGLDMPAQKNLGALRSELEKIKGVNGTAFGNLGLGGGGGMMGIDYTSSSGERGQMSVNFENASSNYVRFFGMNIVRGRDFSKDPQNEYIINEALAKRLGYTDPIGKTINLTNATTPGPIVGVVKDYNYSSLHNKIEPLIITSYSWAPGWTNQLYIKVSTANVPATLKDVNATLAAVTGNKAPDLQFLDDHFKEVYRSERQAGTVIAIIGSLAIGIACLGLFGLAAFVIVQRAKEISIRKVLGATVAGIAMQLSTGFLKWVAIAVVIATPIAWWLTNKWLQNFAYRITIEGWMFAVSALIAVGTALLTVGVLAIRAAAVNPIVNLRNE
jgi:putative ABC transport system permease protein